MWELIWIAEYIAIGLVLWYKSRQPPQTLGEQFYELAQVAQREHSFLMDTTQTRLAGGPTVRLGRVGEYYEKDVHCNS